MNTYIKIWPKAVSEDFCAHLIARFDQDKNVEADPQPDYSTRSFLLLNGRSNWAAECKELNKLVDANVRQYFKAPKRFRSVTPGEWTNDGFLIARYATNDSCVLHVDGQCAVPPQNQLRLATFLLYLNTVGKGGETFFPYQDTKIAPDAGKVVMFPPTHTHPHEVLVTKEPRYILQTWITDPNFYVVDKDEYKRRQRRR